MQFLNSAPATQALFALQREIMDKSKGVFLWVVLVVSEFLDDWESSSTIAELRERLASMPDGLDTFFDRMLRKVPQGRLQEMIAMFQCVLGARRPLTIAEFRYAVAFGSETLFESLSRFDASENLIHDNDAMHRRIQSCCSGLVEVSHSTHTVQFIHQTVVDFLLTPSRFQDLLISTSCLAFVECNKRMLKACIDYLSTKDLRSRYLRSKGKWMDICPPGLEFLEYSSQNWVGHYMNAESEGESQAQQIVRFADPKERHFAFWYCFATKKTVPPPFLTIAVERNLLGYVKDLVGEHEIKNYNPTEAGGLVAIAGNNVAMIRVLLDKGANVNAVGGRFGTAIASAITFGYDDVIQLLLTHGADVELSAPGSPPQRDKSMPKGWPCSIEENAPGWRPGEPVFGPERA